MKAFISILLYINALITFIIVGPLFILFSFILPRELMYRSSKIVCFFALHSLGIRVVMNGAPPKEGSYIYMLNHASFIDPFVFAYTMNAPATALVAKKNYKYPIWNLMLKRWKAIPIERKNKESAIESIKAAEKILDSGISVVILPEGTRTITGNLSRFKKGGFHMAYNTKVPIVPVGCIGAFEFKPKNRWYIKPGKISLNVGEIIEPEKFNELGIEGLIKNVRGQFQKLTGYELDS